MILYIIDIAKDWFPIKMQVIFEFLNSFVAKLLEVLIRCVEETDIDQYESEIAKYEAVMRFEPWYKKLLEKIRNNMIVCGYDLL